MPKITTMPINITKSCYTMGVEENEAEITMYGEIVEQIPTDWWSGEPLDGSFIVQEEFLKDFDTVIKSGAKKVKIRMNSVGGDAGVSILIHNRLRELASLGTEITCIVDGVAMSGGSLIMCACDHVTVNPSSLIMIHKCWSFLFGGYNADELRALAKQKDAWDKAQTEIYGRKTGLSDTIISHMMSETTYMTGKEAVEKGFADELTEEEEVVAISASADRTSLFVNGKRLNLPKGFQLPENIAVIADINGITNKTVPEDKTEGTKKGGKTLMANNLEELRKENPELAAQVEKEVKAAALADSDSAAKQAAEEERSRIAEIDKIAGLFNDDVVYEAKYGDKACSAQEMAYRAAVKAAETGSDFIKNLKEDSAQSNASLVGTANSMAETPKARTPDEHMTEARNQIKALFEKEGK